MCKKCLICQTNNATQTNSHIIPSFLVAIVASYDQSYKRGKELLVSITPFQEKIHIGSLPDTKIEQIFDADKLSQKRIDEELSVSPVAFDYVFCPTCERALSSYLETPYSAKLLRNGVAEVFIPSLFWISVIWRMSIMGTYGFKLSSQIENDLHSILREFLELKARNEDTRNLVSRIDFNYKILYCKDFCRKNAGYIYCDYNNVTNILTIMLGDVCLCFSFDKVSLPSDYKYFSLSTNIIDAPLSNKDGENICVIDEDIFKVSIKEYVSYAANIRKAKDFRLLDYLWSKTGRIEYMPIRMKMLFLNILYDENAKLGEKYLPQRYIDIFNYLCNNYILWY